MVTIALVTRPGNDRAKPDALPAPVLRRPRVQLFLVPPVTKHVSDLRIEAWQPTHALQPTSWTSSTINIELSKSRQDVSCKGRTYLHYLHKKTTDDCVFLQAFIESECNYRGNSLNSYSNVGSAEKCQEICKQSANCDYFIFNLANQVWPLTNAIHVGFFIYAIYFLFYFNLI